VNQPIDELAALEQLMYTSILMPTDGLELAGKALRHGIALARPSGARGDAQPGQSPTSADGSTSLPPARSWREIVAPYARADHRRAVAQLLNTGVPFLLLMAALIYGARSDFWPIFPLAVPAVFLLVRLFIIQHDCGHGSFFASRRANDLLGRALGVLTLTPYAFWRSSHAIHHASSGNLERRGPGDITTLTVREYQALSPIRRLFYRIYRHPVVLFGLGPLYLFVIRNRIPTANPFRHRKIWSSIVGTNATLAALVTVMLLTVGGRAFLLAYLPVILLAASTGIWLFYIQHQFEHTYWASGPAWDFHEAALQGSSFYDLPAVLHWLTGSIGFHHIHHACSKIPNYRLRDCFDQNPEFRRVRRLTLRDSLKCARLALWDEERQFLVSFRERQAK
jgi:acyl-lipid omega-6 desaturase (Delta-12 desaturase)